MSLLLAFVTAPVAPGTITFPAQGRLELSARTILVPFVITPPPSTVTFTRAVTTFDVRLPPVATTVVTQAIIVTVEAPSKPVTAASVSEALRPSTLTRTVALDAPPSVSSAKAATEALKASPVTRVVPFDPPSITITARGTFIVESPARVVTKNALLDLPSKTVFSSGSLVELPVFSTTRNTPLDPPSKTVSSRGNLFELPVFSTTRNSPLDPPSKISASRGESIVLLLAASTRVLPPDPPPEASYQANVLPPLVLLPASSASRVVETEPPSFVRIARGVLESTVGLPERSTVFAGHETASIAVIQAVVLPPEAHLPKMSLLIHGIGATASGTRTFLGASEAESINRVYAILLPPSAELPPPSFLQKGADVPEPPPVPPTPPIPPPTSTPTYGGCGGPVVDIILPEEMVEQTLHVPSQSFTFRPASPPKFTYEGPVSRPLVRVAGSPPSSEPPYLLIGIALLAGIGIGFYFAKVEHT